jgi:hypothetical protein
MPWTYTCPRCGRTSRHPEDARWRYCAACDRFEADVELDDVCTRARLAAAYLRHDITTREYLDALNIYRGTP